jgi:hypothetical protein
MGMPMQVRMLMRMIAVIGLLQIMVIVVIVKFIVPVGMTRMSRGVLMNLLIVGFNVGEGLIIGQKKPIHKFESRHSVALKGNDQGHSEKRPGEEGAGTAWKLDQVLREEINEQDRHHEARGHCDEDLKAVHVDVTARAAHDQHAEQNHRESDQNRKSKENHGKTLANLTGSRNKDKLGES